LSEGDSSVEMLRPFKSEIIRLQYPHGQRFAEDARRAFGEDSTLAQVGVKWERRWDVLYAGQGINVDAMISHWASDKGKLEVKMSEMKLLKWAKNFEG
jgi:hypothetical protein